MKNVTHLLILLLCLAGTLPVRAGIVIMNGLTHEMSLSAGEKSRGGIEIQNNSDKPESVKLYQTDYQFNASGESQYNAPGSHSRSNGKWTTLSTLFVTLAPKESRIIEFEVAVPDQSDLTGTYWSVVMVEGIAPPDTAQSKKGVSINTVLRYAVQVVTHIGETGSQDLQFVKMELTKVNGSLLLADIENTGERAVRPEVSLELFNENGESQGIILSDTKRIYPGTSIRSTLNLDAIKPGKYSGILVAKCDDDHIFGTNLDLEL